MDFKDVVKKKLMKGNKKKKFESKQDRNAADEFIRFVVMFNESINHKPKKKIPMVEKDMRM
ncbi:MAG: hypothetical protein JSV34_04290 [Candidatus Omnitrophota bacterium]|nr:MAG: hypothetical protein JSV34_04290 [Candidatus Omnitrophota bacterium]